MGLLNKLKNVLFEEEEVEETKEVENVSKNTMEFPKITREPKVNKDVKKEQYNVEEETDRELFKSEKTFDFPAFDEEEFDDFSTLKKEEQKKHNEHENIKNSNYKNNNAYSKKKEYTSTKIVKSIKEEPKKNFVPSPVISPVYGILDKNYKREDILTKDEASEQKNSILDVDSVRKKAFGTLEEDLISNVTESIETFDENTEEIEETTTKLNDLLENTIDVEIDVTKEMELPSRLDKTNIEEENIELEENEIDDIEKDDKVSDDTLENDLFDLIDSMYENGEDGE